MSDVPVILPKVSQKACHIASVVQGLKRLPALKILSNQSLQTSSKTSLPQAYKEFQDIYFEDTYEKKNQASDPAIMITWLTTCIRENYPQTRYDCITLILPFCTSCASKDNNTVYNFSLLINNYSKCLVCNAPSEIERPAFNSINTDYVLQISRDQKVRQTIQFEDIVTINKIKYRVVSFIVHEPASTVGRDGHYVSYVRQYQQWLKIDRDEVTIATDTVFMTYNFKNVICMFLSRVKEVLYEKWMDDEFQPSEEQWTDEHRELAVHGRSTEKSSHRQKRLNPFDSDGDRGYSYDSDRNKRRLSIRSPPQLPLSDMHSHVSSRTQGYSLIDSPLSLGSLCPPIDSPRSLSPRSLSPRSLSPRSLSPDSRAISFGWLNDIHELNYENDGWGSRVYNQ